VNGNVKGDNAMAKRDSPNRIRTYRDLVAWQLGMDMAEAVYHATEAFPAREKFGLTSQMRRACVSVPSNVAEGYGRGRKAEFRRFLEMARASLFEVQTQAELARRLGWLKGVGLTQLRDLTRRLDAVMSGLLASVEGREK
jgi:four helix bundle protein